MKIGIYDPYLDTLTGGERYMLTAASCLSSEHQVAVFWDDKDILKKATKKLGIDLKKVYIVPNIFSPTTPFLKKIRKTGEYDVILFLSDGSIPFTISKKTVLHFQLPVEWVKSGFSTKLKLHTVDTIICNSEFTKSYIDRKFNKKSIVLYPPVATEKVMNDPKKKERIILTVGRYSKLPDGSDFKKIGFLIETFKKLYKKDAKGWKFIVVTNALEKEKPYLSKLESKTKGYPIQIIKDISHEKLASVYAKAKLYWHAAGYQEDLDKHPELAEHFGITTVEAMAAGCVPVVINVGGQKEIIKDGKNGFLWETQDELLDKTKRLIKDEKLRQTLAKRGEDAKYTFSVEEFCAQLQEIIR